MLSLEITIACLSFPDNITLFLLVIGINIWYFIFLITVAIIPQLDGWKKSFYAICTGNNKSFRLE
jgi:hypothetical protein